MNNRIFQSPYFKVATLLLVLPVALLVTFTLKGQAVLQTASTYYVAPSGNDTSDAGRAGDRPYKTLAYALQSVPCGSTIQLADGRYETDTQINRPDCLQSTTPIVITGSSNAIFSGSGATYIFEVLTGNVVLSGFTVDGEYVSTQYRKKLIYLNAPDINRLTLKNLTLRNSREECVRLRLNATHNVIMGNHFEHCGRVGGGSTGDNRESIYIGSTVGQQADDHSDFNWIIDNTFNEAISDSTGSECVDIKENASHNLVEGNQCFYQTSDPESGGINVSGNDNFIIHNRIENNGGNGIRLGSNRTDASGEAPDGRNNTVMGNTIRNNARFGINILFEPNAQEILLIQGNCIKRNGDAVANRDALKNAGKGICEDQK